MMSSVKRNCDRAICALMIMHVISGLCAAQQQPARRVALAPDESAAAIAIADGYSIKLIAHEPQVIDPVDAAFDDRGRLWVVEMRDYPLPTSDARTGCIRILSDEDDDGIFETSIVFADQLDMPTGLAMWKDGVVVTVAGQVVWFRDTDGDAKADTQQVWIEGFSRENEQLRANHPRLGPDGWWYIASGLRGGNVIAGPDFRDEDAQPIKLGSRDVRFLPQTGQLEAITGPAQFGLSFDPFGNRFFCSNRNPAVVVRFEQAELVGNPLAGLVPSVFDVLPAGDQSAVHPLVNAWTTSNLHAGQFTAACGVFAHQFSNTQPINIFVCEPTGSLVHARAIDSRLNLRATSENTEWLASRDPWFRPVNVALEPSGGVMIVDMHRAVIEHPQWVPDELKHRPDERWGNDSGRIYVATHSSNQFENRLRQHPIGSWSNDVLVQLIRSHNAWLRETARRLLLERDALESINAIIGLSTDPQLPVANRICALQLAFTLTDNVKRAFNANQLPANQLVIQLCDDTKAESTVPPEFIEAVLRIARRDCADDPRAIAAALRFAESRSSECLLDRLLTLGADAKLLEEIPRELSKRVRDDLQIALTDGLRVGLQRSVQKQGELLVAAGAAFKSQPETLLAMLLERLDGLPVDLPDETAGEIELYAQAAQRLASAAIDRSADTAASIRKLALKSLEKSGSKSASAALGVISELVGKRDQQWNSQEALWVNIRKIAETHTDSTAQQRALTLLGNSPRADDLAFLREAATQNDLPLRLAALRGWGKSADVGCDQFLLDACTSGSPRVQQVMFELIASKSSRLEALAQRLAEEKISARAIGAIELKKLVARANGEVQTQLKTALATIENSDRAKVIAAYQSCLMMQANEQRGKEVFTKHCATCHRIADVGVQVGPDISDSRTQSPSQLLTNILDPNRAIDSNYFRFVALTVDDQVVEGMIAEETSDAIVLRGQNNSRTVLPRSTIQELKGTGVSLMPDGLEAQIDPQAMADLISYIKNWRYLDGSVPK